MLITGVAKTCHNPFLCKEQGVPQDMRYGPAYSPMGASSPSLAQALATQSSHFSAAKDAVERTAGRLRNVSLRVPKMPE
jgi:hypothetical protein